MEPALISGFCNVKLMRICDPPGWDKKNTLQVSSQQTLVLIYLPRKDGKLSWLRGKRRLPGNWGPLAWNRLVVTSFLILVLLAFVSRGWFSLPVFNTVITYLSTHSALALQLNSGEPLVVSNYPCLVC